MVSTFLDPSHTQISWTSRKHPSPTKMEYLSLLCKLKLISQQTFVGVLSSIGNSSQKSLKKK